MSNIQPVLGISPEELLKLIEQESIVLIDVRETYEFDDERIPSSVNVPLSTFVSEDVARIAKGKEVVFQCRLGHRSGIAATEFSNGEQSQKHLEGGINAWKHSGMQTIRGD